MLKIVGSTRLRSCGGVSRRNFLQAGTAGALGLLAAGSSNAAGKEEAGKQGSLKVVEKAKEKHLLWQLTTELTVRVLPPSFTAASGKQGQGPLPVKVQLAASRVRDGGGNFDYELAIEDHGVSRKGKYSLEYGVTEKDDRQILTQRTKLQFNDPLELDLTVAHGLQVTGKALSNTVLPLSYGVVKVFPLAERKEISSYYALGRGSTSTAGEELALPVIGLGFDDTAGGTFAISTDPYCGSQFRVEGNCGCEKLQRGSSVTIAYTYKGSLVPLREEERTAAFVSHQGKIDGMLRSFYETVPEILPSPSWIQEIQLNYYDDISSHNSEPGQGWYHDVQKLAERIPAEHRGKVALCLEGYYDYLGRYSYDHEKRQLDPQWNAYDMQARGVPMTLAEVHKRIEFAKDRGLRVIWYFADGMASDTTSPYYRKDWVIKDEKGRYLSRGFWQWRPELKDKMPAGHFAVLNKDQNPTNHVLDPGNPQVCGWFMGYMEALLKEYGGELDGFTWDETFLIRRAVISTNGPEPTYSDRAFMHLVSRLAQLVQQWRKVNPNLVFLSSDAGWTPYGLVAHGTYQDSACSPQIWPLCFLINYRTCLWSCNWSPITAEFNNNFAVERYGLPQGLSNGFGDDQGPSEMPGEILDGVVRRFLKRIEGGADRTRYLQSVGDIMTFPAEVTDTLP